MLYAINYKIAKLTTFFMSLVAKLVCKFYLDQPFSRRIYKFLGNDYHPYVWRGMEWGRGV